MLFSTPSFLFAFLPAVLIVYYILPKRFMTARNAVLLGFSLLFYAWGEPKFVFAMIGSIAGNYLLALLIARSQKNGGRGKGFVAVAVILNIGMLVGFKYLGWLAGLFSGGAVELDIRLPVGISFFTFQALSYVIDVYRGDVEAQRSLYKLALYVSFFPQLIAGPIVRYRDIAEQIDSREVSVEGFARGVRRFMLGFAQKVLLADNLARVVENAFDVGGGAATAPAAWFALIFFSCQLYFDFAGYSSMAIGLAKMFGFDLLENFNYPYGSLSMREFWRRWHISLSSWFRDYLYIPLGGNRKGKARTYINTFIVFALTGLWHGANINFLIFGLINGLFLTIERMTGFDGDRKKYNIVVRFFLAFYPYIGWLASLVFFRSKDFASALIFFKSLFGQSGAFPSLPFFGVFSFFVGNIFNVCATQLRPPKPRPLDDTEMYDDPDATYAWFFQVLAFLFAVFAMASSTYAPFIYFRF